MKTIKTLLETNTTLLESLAENIKNEYYVITNRSLYYSIMQEFLNIKNLKLDEPYVIYEDSINRYLNKLNLISKDELKNNLEIVKDKYWKTYTGIIRDNNYINGLSFKKN